MKSTLLLFMTCGLLLACTPALVRAQTGAPTVVDSGRLLILTRGQLAATEDFEYVLAGDSVAIRSTMNRKSRKADGTLGDLSKSMVLVVDSLEFQLTSYFSTLEFDGHSQGHGVIPGDTSMTVYREIDTHGDAEKVVQPPGRLFIMDPGMFTLFDVVCHNLRNKTFTRRPLQLITLGDSTRAVQATVTSLGRDTLSWGRRHVITQKLELSDASGQFLVWMNSAGQMLRLEHRDSQLVVMREPPATTAPAKPVRKPIARKPAGAK